MKNKFVGGWLLSLLMAVGSLRGAETNSPGPRVFLHPDRIRYDSQCLTIDGKDVFLYSGAFHYFRCPQELWRDRFQKIKDAGFNCVETYVAWNWAERQMPGGLDDFSKVDLAGLDDFLTMAEQYGLYVIVRPGPYICAEWDTGGYPQWLLTKRLASVDRGHWLRSDDPVYLAWCKHWYDAVCPVIAKHQITRKAPGQPGVVLVQLENEYDYAHFSDQVKLHQVKVLGEVARADGIDVPFITCWTHQVRGATDPFFRQVFDCCNFYPRWDVDSVKKDIEKLRREQPDAPQATTELQGGWFAQVGGKLSENQEGVNAAQINNLTLFAIQNGETMLNYYMLYGGMNPGDWAARELITSYDYNAPIREWGGVGDRYQKVWAIGHMLQEHGARLARSQVVDCDVTGTPPDVSVVMRRAQDGGRYLFIRTSQHTGARKGTAQVKEKGAGSPELVFDYSLEPFGSVILYLPPGVTDAAQGQWLPKAAPAIERPQDLPSPVTIATAKTKSDAGPTQWTPLKPDQDLARAGIYDSRFLFYETRISTAIPTNLQVTVPDGDAVLAAINGQSVIPVASAPYQATFALPAGASTVRLLYENRGHDNGGKMEEPCGILSAQLVSATAGNKRPITGWHMQLVDGTTRRPEVKADFDDSKWTAVSVDKLEADQLTPGQTAVFRAGVEVSAQDLAQDRTILSLGRVDDQGLVYVNGQRVGRTTDWSRTYTFDVTSQLHPGHNVIAVIVKNVEGSGGLGAVNLVRQSAGSALTLAAMGNPAGFDAQYWSPDLATSDWDGVTIGKSASANDPMLAWYRLDFSLPSPSPAVWVPWHLHLEAAGNGFLYLNGHALGRYWQAGPQHDFFLPECWLNFGAGRTNDVTLSLRPIDGQAAIRSAIVEPYAKFAEKR